MANKVLVILASYNGEKYIKEQINSILSQKNVVLDLYIFDDCSTDSTIENISSINDDRIHLIINKVSSGNAANNFLNSLSHVLKNNSFDYDFISFADQDDIWLDNKLNRAITKLTSLNYDLYCSNLFLWDMVNGNSYTILKKDYQQKKYDFLFEGGSAGCTYVLKYEFAKVINSNYLKLEKDNWRFFSHDWYIYFFARLNCFNVYIDNNSFILYRVHQSNVHGQLNINNLGSFLKRIKLIKSGWYFNHINNYIHLIYDNKELLYIYKMYKKNIWSRIYILLKYNFNLMRSKKKFLKFFFLSIFIKPSIK